LLQKSSKKIISSKILLDLIKKNPQCKLVKFQIIKLHVVGKIKLKRKKIAEVHLHECEPDHLDIAELSPIIKAFFIIYIIIKKAVGPFA